MTEEGLRAWWMVPVAENTASIIATDNASYMNGAVNHAEAQNKQVSPDLLMKKLEIYEYWDKN